MPITIPRSNAAPGRSANVQIETPQIGAAIADMGNQILAKADQMRALDENLTRRRTQIDMAHDLQLARMEVEQTGDPAQIDAQWPERREAIEAKYLGPDEKGNPRYSPEVAEQLRLDLDELSNKHGIALGQRAIDLRQSQQEANWLNLSNDVALRAANADPETLGAYYDVLDQAINDRLARGTITPEQAERDRLAARNGIAKNRADALIQNDPEAFLNAAQAGEWADLGADDLTLRTLAAEREIARRQDAAARAAEADAKKRSDAIAARLGDMTDLMAQGFTVEDEAFLNDPEVQQNPAYAAAAAAQSLRNETPNIRQMTVAELDRAIDAEMNAPKAHKWQAERVKVLRQWRDDAAQKTDQDFVAYAAEAGMNVPELAPFDPADPGAFAASVADRLSFDAWAKDRGHTRTQAVFSKAERDQLKTVLDPKADAAPKVALLQSVLAGARGDLSTIAPALELDPVATRAVKSLALSRDPGLAEAMLRGQQKLELGTANVPTDKQALTVLDNVTAGVFDLSPALKSEVLKSARALYADMAAGVNPDGATSIIPFMDDTEAQDLFAQSVQRVLGAAPDRSGKMTVGGLQEWNDAPVYLPPGIGAADVEQGMEAVAMRLSGMVRNPAPAGFGLTDEWVNRDQLAVVTDIEPRAMPPVEQVFARAAARAGDLPELGRDPAARFDSLTLHRVGETDLFEFRYEHAGRTLAVPVKGDPDGRAFRFRLSDLLNEARK